jgi:leucine dehydrogenase
VPLIQAPAIAGAANNQLADEAIADLLAARGILWAPDFVANAGGIINIAVELEPSGYDPARAKERVRGIGDTLRAIYDDAEAGAMTPLTAAMVLARRRLAAASA